MIKINKKVLSQIILPLSPSKWRSFEWCPIETYMKYSGLVPKLSTEVMELGSIIHKLIEQVFKDKNVFTHKNTPEFLKQHIDRFKVNNKFSEDITKKLEYYYSIIPRSHKLLALINALRNSDSYAIEYKIALNQDLIPVDFNAANAYVRGISDLIYQQKDTLYIVDHKTGWAKNEFVITVQLPFYAWLFLNAWPDKKIKRVKVMINNLNKFEFEETSFTRSEALAFKEAVESQIDKMRIVSNWVAKPSFKHCPKCAAKGLCATYDKLVSGSKLPDITQENVKEVFLQYIAHKERANELKALLKEAFESGRIKPIELEGKVIGEMTLSTTETIADSAALIQELLNQGISFEEILKHVSLSKTYINKLRKKQNVKLDKAYFSFKVKEKIALD